MITGNEREQGFSGERPLLGGRSITGRFDRYCLHSYNQCNIFEWIILRITFC